MSRLQSAAAGQMMRDLASTAERAGPTPPSNTASDPQTSASYSVFQSVASRPRILSLSDLALQELSTPDGLQPSHVTRGGAIEMETPTPTQFFTARPGTEEQEDFSRGFARALEEIYQRGGVAVSSGGPPGGGVTNQAPLNQLPACSTWTNTSQAIGCTSTIGQNVGFGGSVPVALTAQFSACGVAPARSAAQSAGGVAGALRCEAGSYYSSPCPAGATAGNAMRQQQPFQQIRPETIASRDFHNGSPHVIAGRDFHNGSPHAIAGRDFHNGSPHAIAGRDFHNGSPHVIAGQDFYNGNPHVNQISGLSRLPLNQSCAFSQQSQCQGVPMGAQIPPVAHFHPSTPAMTSCYPQTVGIETNPNPPAVSSSQILPATRWTPPHSQPQNFGFEPKAVNHSFDSVRVKSEPDFSSSGSDVRPPSQPVDLDAQERMKLERKRAKNRVAAQRCQLRKVEKVARLEDKVARLHEQNGALAQTVAALNAHVARLRGQIVAHAERGCRLMVPNVAPEFVGGNGGGMS